MRPFTHSRYYGTLMSYGIRAAGACPILEVTIKGMPVPEDDRLYAAAVRELLEAMYRGHFARFGRRNPRLNRTAYVCQNDLDAGSLLQELAASGRLDAIRYLNCPYSLEDLLSRSIRALKRLIEGRIPGRKAFAARADHRIALAFLSALAAYAERAVEVGRRTR